MTELLDGLHVDTGRMAAVVKQQSSALLAEQRSIRELSEQPTPTPTSTPATTSARPAG